MVGDVAVRRHLIRRRLSGLRLGEGATARRVAVNNSSNREPAEASRRVQQKGTAMKWFTRTATCKTCHCEFRKHKVVMPSLVGFTYCSSPCERLAWDAWAKAATR